MSKKRHSPEQIIAKLREAKVLLAQGQTVAQTAKALGVTEQGADRAVAADLQHRPAA